MRLEEQLDDIIERDEKNEALKKKLASDKIEILKQISSAKIGRKLLKEKRAKLFANLD
jgi:uncharacterized protein (UPF0335 family)